MSKSKFLTALVQAAREYGGWPTEESEEQPRAAMSQEERVAKAINAAGLKTTDSEAKDAIKAVLLKYGTGYGMPVDPDPLSAMVFVENAFEAWRRAEAKKGRKKPAPKKRPASMATKKR